MIGVMLLAAGALQVNVDDAPWLRSAWDDMGGRLEVAARAYDPIHTGSPTVWLVGVTHVGEEDYYIALEELLGESDMVVFESVLPEGGTAPGGETDTQRAASTRHTADLVAAMAAGMHRDELADWNTAIGAMSSSGGRMSSVVRWLGRDGWGRPWIFDRSGALVRLVSYGADGRAGGTDADADITVEIAATAPAEEGSQLQRELAESLGLRFQLDSLPYTDPAWVPGDMRIDEIAVAFEERGQSISDLTDLMSGSGIAGGIAHGIVRLIPIVDSLFAGRVVDTMRLLLIDMLGNEALVEGALEMQGPAFVEVLLNLRNIRALEVLQARSGGPSPPGTVAVLYGAGHMGHMSQVLVEKYGYVVAETRWLPAIVLQYDESSLTQLEATMLREWMGSMSTMFGP